MLDTRALRPKTSGRFASLMELYERNYMLVRLLVPRLRELDGEGLVYRAAVGDGPVLVLYDLQHDRFTTTFHLSYRFRDGASRALEPDLAIRLYHDARTCEVMSGLLSSRTGDSRRVRDLDDGFRRNRFLNRWLAYCLREGYGFHLAADEGSTPRSRSSWSDCALS